MKGHESGHDPSPPVGLDWGAYVATLVEEHGGWAALGDELMRRAHALDDFPCDPQVIEKGLRRLSRRGHKSGGQYGRWLIRFFGMSSSLVCWAAWMGQLHSRFADLPSSLRLEQLRLWDRPPLSESRLVAWIHVGMAWVWLRMQRRDDALGRLAMAEQSAASAGVACQIEVALLRAQLLTDEGRRSESEALFDQVQSWFASEELSDDDRRCYEARLLGQRAYHLTRSLPGQDADLRGALALFERIADEPFHPFVAFRKHNGLAYCHWQLGDSALGVLCARLAEQHAGDGGYVRLRIMALNLQSRMLPEADGAQVRARAERLARLVEDEDLLRRVRKQW